MQIVAPVNYGEEDIPNDFPCRTGDVWEVIVDVETRKILEWPGPAAEVSMKVCDQGSYYLLDRDRNEVASIEEDYVPNDVVPGEHGDYIEMHIDADGTVTNWPGSPDFSQFFADK